jgi:ubiquinone/menaquinone biosynthesis C-methylase UbiE
MKDHKSESRVFFDKLAPKYDRHYFGSHGRQQYQRVLAAARSWVFGSVLDVGCGAGSLLSLLKRPTLRLAGADLSAGMIAEAKKRLGDGADLRVADSEELPWDAGSFDLVVSTDSFHHYPHPMKALSEMKRVLKREGHLVIGDVWAPTPFRQLGNLLVNLGKEGDVRVYSEGEFRRMLAEVGFAEITRAAISPSAIVMDAAARW